MVPVHTHAYISYSLFPYKQVSPQSGVSSRPIQLYIRGLPSKHVMSTGFLPQLVISEGYNRSMTWLHIYCRREFVQSSKQLGVRINKISFFILLHSHKGKIDSDVIICVLYESYVNTGSKVWLYSKIMYLLHGLTNLLYTTSCYHQTKLMTSPNTVRSHRN